MSYNTKQKNIILNYLKENSNEAFNVNQIYDALKDYHIGLTTIYRFLNKMYEDKKINKFLNENKEASYQYIKDQNCHYHMHLKCLKCLKIIHLDCDIIETFKNHINEEHGFNIKNDKTVIYGLCKECNLDEK